MMRFLRENAELITSICVVLSLVLGGALLYLKSLSDTPVDTPTPTVSAPVAAAPTTATSPATEPPPVPPTK